WEYLPPAQAVFGAGGGAVFSRDHAAIAMPLERGTDRLEIHLTCTWLVTAGMVSHLNMADQRCIGVDCRGWGGAAGSPVVHVGEQRDVGMTAGPAGEHHLGGVLREGQQVARILTCVEHLDQDSSADLVCRPGGVSEIARGLVMLLCATHAVEPVAVQSVE